MIGVRRIGVEISTANLCRLSLSREMRYALTTPDGTPLFSERGLCRIAAAGPKVLDSLPADSQLREPLRRVMVSADDRTAEWMAKWLCNAYCAPHELGALGAAARKSRADDVANVAGMMRLARASEMVGRWEITVAGIEWLWNARRVTPSRRAAFLVDLRHLAKHTAAGAPASLAIEHGPARWLHAPVGELLREHRPALAALLDDGIVREIAPPDTRGGYRAKPRESRPS